MQWTVWDVTTGPPEGGWSTGGSAAAIDVVEADTAADALRLAEAVHGPATEGGGWSQYVSVSPYLPEHQPDINANQRR